MPSVNEHFELKIISDEEATCVAMVAKLFDDECIVTASSKVHPKDTHNEDIGIALASARAFRRMANRLEERAEREAGMLESAPSLQDYMSSFLNSLVGQQATIRVDEDAPIEDGGI